MKLGDGDGTTGYRKTEEELRTSEQRYRMVIEQSPLSIHVFSPDGRSLLANASWNELWYLGNKEEPEGANLFEDEQIQATGLIPYIEESLASRGPVSPPPLLYDPDRSRRAGEPRWLQAFIYPVKDEEGDVNEVTLIIEDVTERKNLEEKLFYRAHHDDLTGLPNRTLFLDRLGQALLRTRSVRRPAGRHTGGVAVLFLGLDNFKYVNDSLGRKVGNHLLVGVSERLEAYLQPGDTVARTGGDEFAVLLEDVSEPAQATDTATEVLRELEAPFALPDNEVFITASIGVAPGSLTGNNGSHNGTRAGDLLRNANIAMHRAKEAGKNCYQVYETSMRNQSSERLKLENDLRRAVEREQFVLHYQPQVELESGKVVGVEALVRWEHPERGLVYPAEFIPLAEETGLVVSIGRQVLEEACRGAQTFFDRFREPHPTMFVNLSAKQFRHPRLAEEISGILEKTGIEPGHLALEITESVVMSDAPAADSTLKELKALGLRVAVDDFGTGYSSMSYLLSFPVDYLKVDRSFVSGLFTGGTKDEVITSGIINLAHALDLGVIAEGVETKEQLARLRGMNCEAAQGYYFAKPLPEEDFARWLATRAVR